MKESLIKQFEFEYWSNHLILDALKTTNPIFGKGLQLLSHILSSHCMWLSRVNKTDFTCTLFQERTLDECEQLMTENLEGWRTYLSSQSREKLNENIEFLSAWETNPSKRIISIEDALIHIINHSSYHRGQIVMGLKNCIEVLPLTTYIMYASEIIE